MSAVQFCPSAPQNTKKIKHFRVAARAGLAAEKPELYEKAIKRGLAAGGARAYPFVALAAAYIDGKPIERVAVIESQRLILVPTGSSPHLGDDDLDRT